MPRDPRLTEARDHQHRSHPVTDPASLSTTPDRFVIHPHELGMAVHINAPRSNFHDHEGIIDEIAIYNTTAHGIDFTGWDLLVAFHDGRFHDGRVRAYSAFNFDEARIIPSAAERFQAERDEARQIARICYHAGRRPNAPRPSVAALPDWLTDTTKDTQ